VSLNPPFLDLYTQESYHQFYFRTSLSIRMKESRSKPEESLCLSHDCAARLSLLT
jgi:hypothetical protein